MAPVLPIFTTFGCVKPLSHTLGQHCACVCVFCRLQQLDRHCQSSAQQVCELLAKQSQLMQERNIFTEDMRNLHVEVTRWFRPAAADVTDHKNDVFLSLNPCRCQTGSTLCSREPIPPHHCPGVSCHVFFFFSVLDELKCLIVQHKYLTKNFLFL